MYVGDKSQKKIEEMNITKIRRVGREERDVIRNGHKGGLAGGLFYFLVRAKEHRYLYY